MDAGDLRALYEKAADSIGAAGLSPSEWQAHPGDPEAARPVPAGVSFRWLRPDGKRERGFIADTGVMETAELIAAMHRALLPMLDVVEAAEAVEAFATGKDKTPRLTEHDVYVERQRAVWDQFARALAALREAR